MKKFITFLSALLARLTPKFLLFLSISLLLPVALHFSFLTYQNYIKRKEYNNEQNKEALRKEVLERRIDWKIDTSVFEVMSIASLELKTKYFNDLCYYLASVKMKNINDPILNRNNTIHINFVDKDGFTLYTFDLNFYDKVRLLDGGNDVVGARWEGQLALNRDLYEKFKDVRITWTFL